MKKMVNLFRQQSISILPRLSISPISIGQTNGLIAHALHKY